MGLVLSLGRRGLTTELKLLLRSVRERCSSESWCQGFDDWIEALLWSFQERCSAEILLAEFGTGVELLFERIRERSLPKSCRRSLTA